MLLPHVSERVRHARTRDLSIYRAHAQSIRNIGWTVRLDRRRDIVPPLPPATFFFWPLFYFSSRPRAVWFSAISDKPEWANCACGIACFQSRTRDVPGGEGSTHSKRSARNVLSAMLRHVILSIWRFYRAGVNPWKCGSFAKLRGRHTNRREMFRRKETYEQIKLPFVKLIVQLGVLNFNELCRNVKRSFTPDKGIFEVTIAYICTRFPLSINTDDFLIHNWRNFDICCWKVHKSFTNISYLKTVHLSMQRYE